MISISNRLKKVASYVTEKRLADIGSDHAYLPIYLAKNNIINYAIAGEVVLGPHKSSIKNVEDNNLDNIVFCKKGSGLDVISINDDIEVITICGMGGKLIADILENGKDKLINHPKLILQPNVASDLVRIKLQELGYKITQEEILEEDNHIYEIIVAQKGVMKLTQEEILFGVFLPQIKNQIFVKKWQQEIKKLDYVLNEIKKSTKNDKSKINHLQNKKIMIKNIL